MIVPEGVATPPSMSLKLLFALYMLSPLIPFAPLHILLAGMVATASRATATPAAMNRGLYELAVSDIELNHDVGPELVENTLLSLMKDVLVIFTLFSMMWSWVMTVRWCEVCTISVSPERIRTAPQLNLSEDMEQKIGTVTKAGDCTSWVVELLPFLPSHDSFNTRDPENSRRNDSEIASVEVTVLALMEDEAVQILPTTWAPFPRISVSRDMMDCSGMRK